MITTSGDNSCWCGSSEETIVFRTSRFGLLRCLWCESYRIDPPPLRDEGQAAAFYTGYYERLDAVRGSVERRGRHRTSRFWRVATRLPLLCDVRRLAMDVGCGDGTLCGELRDAGWPKVVGFDLSRHRIAKARRLYPEIEFHATPVWDSDLQVRSVDLMVMDNVIEHLVDPIRMLSELRPYLQGSGKLVIITPNMRSGNFRLLGRRWTPELAPHAHVFLYTARALKRLLGRSGYNVVGAGTFSGPLSSWRRRFQDLFRFRVREMLWRAGQDAGMLYGRMLGAGAMLYAIACPDRTAGDGR